MSKLKYSMDSFDAQYSWVNDLFIYRMSLLERYPLCQVRDKRVESEKMRIETNGKYMVPIANHYPLTPRESQHKSSDDFIYKARISHRVEIVQHQNTPNDVDEEGESRRVGQSLYYRPSTKREYSRQNALFSDDVNEWMKYNENTEGFSAHSKGSKQIHQLTTTDQEHERTFTSPRHYKRDLISTKNLPALSRGSKIDRSEESEIKGSETNFSKDNGDSIQWKMPRNFLDHSERSKQELTKDREKNQTITAISDHENGPILRKNVSSQVTKSNKKDEVMGQNETTFPSHGGKTHFSKKSREFHKDDSIPRKRFTNNSRQVPKSNKKDKVTENETTFQSQNGSTISSKDFSGYQGDHSGARQILNSEENHGKHREPTLANHKDVLLSSRKTTPKLSPNYENTSEDQEISRDNYKQPSEESQEAKTVEEEGLSGLKKVTKSDKNLPQGAARNLQKKDNRKFIASKRNKKTNTPQSRTSTSTNSGPRRLLSREKKVETRMVVKEAIESNEVYQRSRKRILKWMSNNYGRIIDIFKKFDVDGSGSLSMDEFCLGMKSLGAPGTEEELRMMAQVLDFDNDDSIDFSEFRKLKKYNRIKPKHTRASHASEETDRSSLTRSNRAEETDRTHSRRVSCETVKADSLPKLKPCTKCYLGITEPLVQSKYDRHICLQMSSISKVSTQKWPIGQFKFDVSPDMTVYGVQRLTKAELGSTATNVRIFRKQDKKRVEQLEQHKHLGDYGYEGAPTSENPEMVSLFYDYTYPRLDCPLVSASLSNY